VIQNKSRLPKDEISDVLGSRFFAERYYPNGLKLVTVGPHSLDLVSVSRFYMHLRPQVVVDFEPSPLDEKFWFDEKQKFFFERGIVYVPVYLKERLMPAQFLARYKECRDNLLLGKAVINDNKALAAVTVEEVIQHLPPDRTVEDVLKHPASQQWIDIESLRRLDAKIGTKKITGGARTNMLRAVKRQVIEDLREKVKRGRMGPISSDLQPALAARG
jgi:hypothetical protein